MPVRSFIISALMLLASARCGAQTWFKVTGTCPDGWGKVQVIDMASRSVVAEPAVSEGHFGYTGHVPAGTLMALAAGGRQVRFFVDSVDVYADMTTGQVRGSVLNIRVAECMARLDSVMRRHAPALQDMQTEWTTASDARRREIRADANDLVTSIALKQAAVLGGYKDSMVPAAFICDMYSGMPIQALDVLVDSLAPYYGHQMMAGARRYYESKLKRRPGTMYTDIALGDMQGVMHQLGEWCGKGQYVLVDFWASWCMPCRKEMPVIVEAYVKYQKMGFQVVGVSLDENQSAWQAAVSALGMDWVQLSDLKGWDSDAARVYGLVSIPSNVLLDGDGRIVASDLRGEALLDALCRVYGY